MKLIAARAQDLDAYLPTIDWHLRSFADRTDGKATVEDFIDSIRAGNRQLWIATAAGVVAVALTEVLADRKNTVRLTHCAGEGAESWAYLIGNIKAWSEERGSEAFEVVCRLGWEKYLKNFGFKKTHIVMEVQ